MLLELMALKALHGAKLGSTAVKRRMEYIAKIVKEVEKLIS